jgi:ribosomal protein S18 acetylase RimI-like enzyme
MHARRIIGGMLRRATLDDLRTVATWVSSARECELWAGWRVRFPIELDLLASTIDFAHQGGFVMVEGHALVAFGQIVPKARRRAHLARLIVAPALRGRGLGARLVTALLDRTRQSGHALASLNVDPANATAIHLYEKLGFRDASRPEDEPDPQGSRYMQLRL